MDWAHTWLLGILYPKKRGAGMGGDAAGRDRKPAGGELICVYRYICI